MDDASFDDSSRAYRIGLRLRDLGADDDLIADCLEMDPQGILALLEIGAQKLERALGGARLSDIAGEMAADAPDGQ